MIHQRIDCVNPMIERVARAICAKAFEDPAVYWGTDPIPVAVDRLWRDYVDHARAALRAMAEVLRPGYEAAIDEALK